MIPHERFLEISSWLIGWLVGFYGISTHLSNIIPNPLYTYIYVKYI